MRTAGALAATGLLLFIGGIGACTSDETAAAPPVPDGGATPDSGGGGTDAAEGGGPSKPGDPKRGSRLAPEFRETSDGASEFAGMVDTGLGSVRCFGLLGEDGVTRCLPSDSPYLGTAGAVYADSNCGVELASIQVACKKPVFALRINDGTGCNVGTSVYDVGAQHTTQIYRRQDPTTCEPIASDAKLSYWVLGAKRAAADFVKLTKRTETIAGGIGLVMLDGDDGSSAPGSELVDVARAKGCRESKATDGKTRCFPANSGYVNGFIDNGCMKPAALVNPYDCDPLYVASTATANTAANDGTEQVFELGTKQPTKETFTQNGPACDGPFTGSADVYERGVEIPPATFPELGFANAGGSRIIAKRWTAAGTMLPPTIELHDAMLDVKCSWMTAADGKERCLPNGVVRQFSDDQCTVPVTQVQGTQAPPKYVIGFGTGCPRPFAVFTVGAEVTPKPTELYDNYNGCLLSGTPGPNTIYAVGAEVPPSTFVEATRVTK